MKKRLFIFLSAIIFAPAAFAGSGLDFFKLHIFQDDTKEIKSLLNSQVKYANKANFKKFISTFTKDYKNADGFDLDSYSKLVKEVWSTYDNMEYDVEIRDIAIMDDTAIVKVLETSYANLPASQMQDGILTSEADSIYYLKKQNGDWKVSSDKVISESTSMLYGEAKGLDIKLSAPQTIEAGKEYTASLEFTPPEDIIAIASIANDKVEYPKRQPKEVYRKLPEDNLLERIFVSNSDNKNEYVIASIGLTKADIEDLSIKLSLTGFGYKIIRVNVVSKTEEEEDVKTE